MDSHNHNDLVPRPSPKPSQIELPMISNKPEVPELSFVFDMNPRKNETFSGPLVQSQPRYTNCMDAQPIQNRIRDQSLNLHAMSETLESMKYSPRPIQRHGEFRGIPKHVSFSPPMPQDSSSVPFYSPISKPEQTNCCCNHNSEPPHRPNSTPPYYNYNRPSYDSKNENPYSYLPVFTNYDRTMNKNQSSYVTMDEYQKMISQFTNMILNLSYKFDKIVDNSTTQEELNQVTKNLQLQVGDLTQRVNELSLKLEKNNDELKYRIREEHSSKRTDVEEFVPDRPSRSCGVVPVVDTALEAANKQCDLANINQNELTKNVESNQLKRMYDNIVRDVKNMMELNSPTVDNIERTNFIQKAAIEQLRELGINVEELEQNERYQQCHSNHSHKVASNNGVASSDMSVLMNNLAMKYIPEGRFDPRKQERKQGDDVSIRSNCNNVSIATLQYMERYHLLSTTEQNSGKSVGISKPKASSHHQESNDLSFVR